MDRIMVDKRALRDELTEAFIVYQHHLEQPFPRATETRDVLIQKYMSDPIFHAKVDSLVSGVMCIVDKHLGWLKVVKILRDSDGQPS